MTGILAPPVDPRRHGDQDLLRHLLIARGAQWAMGEQADDPYALLLCGMDNDVTGFTARPAVHRSDLGPWVVTGHEPAAEALADRRLTRRPPRPLGRILALEDFGGHGAVLSIAEDLLELSPQDEERLLTATSAALKDVGSYVPIARKQCEEILDAVGGEVDLVADFARPYAIATAAALLGLGADAPQPPAGLLDAQLCPPTLEAARALVTSVDALRANLARHAPTGPLPIDLVRHGVPPALIRLTSALIWAVGVEAVTTLTGRALVRLTGWDPAGAEAAVDEAMRLDPLVRLENRYATTRIDLAGQQIEQSEQVVIVTAVVPAQSGISTLITPLARVQAITAVRALAERFPALRLTGPLVTRSRSPVTRALCELRAVRESL